MVICNICFDELIISERGLVNTGLCVHNYCLACYTNYCISKYNQNKSVNCPVCKVDLVDRNLYIKPENDDVEFEDVNDDIVDDNDDVDNEQNEEDELIEQLVKIQIATNLQEINEANELKKAITDSIRDLDKKDNIVVDNEIEPPQEQYYDVLNGPEENIDIEEQKRLEEMYELRQQEMLFAKFKISN
jgi:hypothetical protein